MAMLLQMRLGHLILGSLRYFHFCVGVRPEKCLLPNEVHNCPRLDVSPRGNANSGGSKKGIWGCAEHALLRRWTHSPQLLPQPALATASSLSRTPDLRAVQVRCKHGAEEAGRQDDIPPAPRDKILLKGLVFHGYHGVLEEERRLGQKFIVDIEASASLRKAGLSDDLEDTVNYAAVYKDVKAIVEGKPHQLLEAVAQSIADDLFEKHPSILDIIVTLKKPHVAIEGTCDFLGVQIHRARIRSG